MADEFDLLVIGGGTAGLVAAAGSASLGARVALLERDRLGGECLWTGCVPSKALIGTARLAHALGRTAEYGLPPVEAEFRGGRSGRRILESVRAARARVQPHDDPERFRDMGVEVVEGAEARFAADGTVEADGRSWRARRTLIATGSRPAVPPVEGLREAGCVTHEDVFDREELPASALVLGAGAVGVELAQACRRVGVEVTLLEAESRVLPREDAELAALLREVLEGEGVRVLTGVRAVRAGRDGGERTLRIEPARPGTDGGGASGGETLRAQEILVAAGRTPGVAGLGLEEAGIEVGPEGVVVDGKLRTTRPGVFAAGDVIGGLRFTHVADHEARAVVRNALFPFARGVDYSVVPRAIYTDPELASVGLSEAEARERHGDRVAVHRYDMAELDRAITDRQAVGRVKLVAGPRGELLGAQILAHRAGSLVVEAALALRLGADVTDLAELVHPYPTLSEGVRRAAQEAYRARLTPSARRWLDGWFRLARRLGL